MPIRILKGDPSPRTCQAMISNKSTACQQSALGVDFEGGVNLGIGAFNLVRKMHTLQERTKIFWLSIPLHSKLILKNIMAKLK